jgi:hypothetical protein
MKSANCLDIPDNVFHSLYVDWAEPHITHT